MNKKIFFALGLLVVSVPVPADAGKSALVLPAFLSDLSHDLPYVCKKSDKPLAIVARKTHYCDDGVKQCMYVTAALAEPCNSWLTGNFSLFHLRLGKYSHYDRGEFTFLPNQKNLSEKWGEEQKNAEVLNTPGLILIDTKKCSIIGHIFLYDVKTQGPRFQRASLLNQQIVKALPAFKEYQESLLPGLQEPKFQTCAQEASEFSLEEIWHGMNQQAQ